MYEFREMAEEMMAEDGMPIEIKRKVGEPIFNYDTGLETFQEETIPGFMIFSQTPLAFINKNYSLSEDIIDDNKYQGAYIMPLDINYVPNITDKIVLGNKEYEYVRSVPEKDKDVDAILLAVIKEV